MVTVNLLLSLFAVGLSATGLVFHRRWCRAEVLKERAACLEIVRSQPLALDTHTGLRQQWVKNQIADKILARDGDGR